MHKFKYESIEIWIRRATIRDDMHARIINAKLQEGVDTNERGYWKLFGDLCAQTIKAKGLPFDPTIVHKMDKAGLTAAYEAFLDLPSALSTRWINTVNKANEVSDPDLGPEPLPDDALPNA